jgi:hypothetical protein
MVHRVRQQRHLAGPLDGQRQFPLVFGAVIRDAPRDDLSPFRQEVAKHLGVFVIDPKTAVRAEATDTAATKNPSPSFPFDNHGKLLPSLKAQDP